MSELIKALVHARKAIGAAKKGTANPFFKSKYADLGAVIEAVKEPLEANGLTFVQDIKDGTVITVILHESGERLDLAPFPIIAIKPDAQGHGSALTYARRYSLQTALGVPAEDDDGNKASEPAKKNEAEVINPVKASMEGEPELDPAKVQHVASAFIDFYEADKSGAETASYGAYELSESLDTGMQLAVWLSLKEHSKVRTWIKKCLQEHRPANVTA